MRGGLLTGVMYYNHQKPSSAGGLDLELVGFWPFQRCP